MQRQLRIVASDIDTKVLATAQRGVYDTDARGLSPERLQRHFLRGKGSNAGFMRVKPELAKLIDFRPFNLMRKQWAGADGLGEPFDIIFCRNVMIYFDGPTQRQVLQQMHAVLKPGGLLYVGHSENFTEARDAVPAARQDHLPAGLTAAGPPCPGAAAEVCPGSADIQLSKDTPAHDALPLPGSHAGGKSLPTRHQHAWAGWIGPARPPEGRAAQTRRSLVLLLGRALSQRRGEGAAGRILRARRRPADHHHAGLLHRRLPVGPRAPHRRHEPFHAARRRGRLWPLRQLRDGSADQRADEDAAPRG